MARTGGCTCGAIRYEYTGAPLFVHACHCTICQRASGGAFGITLLVTEAQFRVTAGTPGEARLTGGSGAAKQSYFCPECGGWLFGRTETRPGAVAIRPGTLDDKSDIVPQAHIWTGSKLAWLPLPPDVPVFETTYDPAALWPEASLRRLEAAAQKTRDEEDPS